MKDLNYYKERTGDLVIENEELKRKLADADRKVIELTNAQARQPVREDMDL